MESRKDDYTEDLKKGIIFPDGFRKKIITEEEAKINDQKIDEIEKLVAMGKLNIYKTTKSTEVEDEEKIRQLLTKIEQLKEKKANLAGIDKDDIDETIYDSQSKKIKNRLNNDLYEDDKDLEVGIDLKKQVVENVKKGKIQENQLSEDIKKEINIFSDTKQTSSTKLININTSPAKRRNIFASGTMMFNKVASVTKFINRK